MKYQFALSSMWNYRVDSELDTGIIERGILDKGSFEYTIELCMQYRVVVDLVMMTCLKIWKLGFNNI